MVFNYTHAQSSNFSAQTNIKTQSFSYVQDLTTEMETLRKGSLLLAAIFMYLAICSGSTASLTWKFTDNKAALCNDFTRAGFFHRNASSEELKWVIFLESGFCATQTRHAIAATSSRIYENATALTYGVEISLAILTLHWLGKIPGLRDNHSLKSLTL